MPSDSVSFQIVQTNLGNKKTVHVDVGAGGRVDRGSITITIHKELYVDGDGLVCDLTPAGAEGASSVIQLIDGLHGLKKYT